MSEPRRILVLSSLDSPAPSPSLAHPCPIAPITPLDSVAPVAASVVEVLSAMTDLEVAHRAVFDPAEVTAAIEAHPGALVFNLCEGLAGRSQLEGLAARLLEHLGATFTGASSVALHRCLHKAAASRLLAGAGVQVPALVRVTSPDELPDVGWPAIVKPAREDGSLGISSRSVVRDRRSLREQVAEVIATYRQPAVVQRYIEGRELAVSLLGWPASRALPPGEILFDAVPAGHPRILTFEAKWHERSAAHLATPSVAASLSPDELRRVVDISQRASDVLGLRDYGRVDLRLDEQGALYVIDVNPNCELSRSGGFCRAAARAGLSHGEVLRVIVDGAQRRGAERPGSRGLRGRGMEANHG